MRAIHLPTPTEWAPGLPDALIDLQSEAGAALVQGTWRTCDAEVVPIEFVSAGSDFGPSGAPNRTYDILPHAEGLEFDDSHWQVLTPAETELRLGGGRVCFTWYRIAITIPPRVGDFDPTGSTAVLEVVLDDYAEVWVDGALPIALGKSGGNVVSGFNAPNRVVLGQTVQPGQQFQIAIFGINGPISLSPRNYIWFRSATVDFYRAERVHAGWAVDYEIERMDPALDAIVPSDALMERVASGLSFAEGPVWSADGALLFSAPAFNSIYRWTPDGHLHLYMSKSGYRGLDIGAYSEPGSNGLTFDPQGRLTLCQHGNRRVVRVEKRGNQTVLAERYEGKRLNSPNDLVYHSNGTLYFTDPPYGLPKQMDDPAKELDFSGVYRVQDGKLTLLTDALALPNGIALSPDERYLYVGDGDLSHKVVMRYPLNSDGTLAAGDVFFDLNDVAGGMGVDGIKVDQAGNVYVCAPRGIWVLSPEGTHLGTIHGPEQPTNLAWGDADGQTLYCTAMSSIYRIRLAIAGVRPI